MVKEPLDGFFEHEISEGEPEEITTETTETNAPVVEEAAESAPAQEADATTQTDDRKNWIPVGALIAERDKAKLAQEEAEQLRARIAEFEAKQNASIIPDPFDDPAGYHAHMAAQMRQEIAQELAMARLNDSRTRAVAEHGAAFVDEVAEWAGEYADQHPDFMGKVMAHPDPAYFVIEQKRNADLLKQFQTDPDAFVRQRAIELGLADAAQSVAPATTTPARKPTGPTSLNRITSRENASTTKPEDAFDALFKSK
jgi:hypothetical protein